MTLLHHAADPFRLLVESVKDYAIYLLDAEGRIASWNRGAERIKGYTAAEVLGQPFAMLFSPEDAARGKPQRDMAAALAHGKYEEEGLRSRKGGTLFWAISTLTALHDGDRHVGFAVVVRDIAERKEAESRLRHKNEELVEANRQAAERLSLLETLIQHAPVGVAFVDQEFRFRHINDELAEINGLAPADHLGRTIAEVVPNLWPTLGPLYERVRATAAAVTDVEVNLQVAPTPGEERHWLTGFYPVRGHDGLPIGTGMMAVEITERKRAEQELRRLAERGRAVLENSSDVISIHDADGTMIYQSPSIKPVLGYEEGELVGQKVLDYIHPDDVYDTACRIAQLKAHPGVQPPFETRFRHKNGEWRWCECTGSNLLDSPALQGLLFNARDVTDRKRAEEELRRRERRYRALVTATSKLIWTATPAGAVIPPDAATTFSGRPRAESAGWGWTDVVHPDDRERATRQWRDAVASGAPLVTEVRIRRADGAWRRIAAQVVPVKNESGTIEEWIGVGEDVTELRHTELWLEAILNSAFDAIITMSEQGVIVSANAAAHQIFGYTAGELIGQPVTVLMRDIDRDQPADARAGLGLDERRIIGAIQEMVGKRKDDSTFPAELIVTEFHLDNTRHFTGIVRDITQRRKAEQDVRLRDRAIQAVLQGILITDASQPDNPIIFASRGFERVTGYRAEEAVGRNCRFLQGPNTDPATRAVLHQAIHAGQECSVEILNYRKDGTPFWNALFVTPVRDDTGGLTHFVGVQADVTERRKLEEQYQQAQKMEAIGRLAGGVAHDFNNLLTVINGYSQVLLGMLHDHAKAVELLGEIHKAGERAAGLTHQLLAYSRRQMLQPRVLNLNTVVENARKMLGRLIGEDVELTAVLAADLPRIKADPGQLDQVLMNLCVNARDAMPTGGTITIATSGIALDATSWEGSFQVRPGPYALLAVSDTGIGMDAPTQARIFEPFFTTKGPGHGTGLGLATVYGIVKQSGGYIQVSSAPGQGSTFKIYLPAVDEAPPVSAAPAAAEAPGGTETVLLVEDEEAVRVLGRLLLQRSGYRVLVAATGAEALEVVARHAGRIDLLVTDVVMPGMSGRQVAEALCRLNPALRVLFVSGYTDDAVVRHGVLEAETAFLQKPFTPNEFAGKVRELLDRKD